MKYEIINEIIGNLFENRPKKTNESTVLYSKFRVCALFHFLT